MDDRRPFHTNALAFPLASAYFAKKSSSFGSISCCQSIREKMGQIILLTRRNRPIFHPYVKNGRSFRHGEAAGHCELLEAVSVLHKLRTALDVWSRGTVVLKRKSLSELQGERECCITRRESAKDCTTGLLFIYYVENTRHQAFRDTYK